MSAPRSTHLRPARGFSLVEVMLAVFILGVGVISIAAVFPAGIALQRQSNDDVLGPLVAQNGLALLRSRLKQEDFGSFADFRSDVFPHHIPTFLPAGGGPLFTMEGDWPWMRPGFIFDDPSTAVDEGAIDIFSQQHTRKVNGMTPFTPLGTATELPAGWPTSGGPSLLWGIPYNPTRYAILPSSGAGSLPDWHRAFPEPRVIVTQRERYWPMSSTFTGALSERPQYVWECMFRRFNGRVQVAIFVYRVSFPGGQPRYYSVAPGNAALSAPEAPSSPLLSPLPVGLSLPSSGANVWQVPNPLPAGQDPTIIPGTTPGSTLDLTQPRFMWQVAGQWILDQNNNVHRVLAGRRTTADGPVRFARPIPVMPPAAVYGARPGVSALSVDPALRAVLQAWYMPTRDANGVSITPVYILVEEL